MKPYKIVPKESITFTNAIFVPKYVEVDNNYNATQEDFCIIISSTTNSVNIDLTQLELPQNDGMWICLYCRQYTNAIAVICTSIDINNSLGIGAADQGVELVYSSEDNTWYIVSSHNL